MQNKTVTLRNGNAGTVVYESQFGKLLIVEYNDFDGYAERIKHIDDINR